LTARAVFPNYFVNITIFFQFTTAFFFLSFVLGSAQLGRDYS